MPPKSTRILLACLLALTAVGAWATDLVLNVPLRLKGLPRGIARAKVVCQIYPDATQSLSLGSGMVIEPIDFRSGTLVTNTRVRVNLRPEHRGILPTHYTCRLFLLVPWAIPPWQMPGPDARDATLLPAPDTEFTGEVTGGIPQGIWARPPMPPGPEPPPGPL